MDKDCARIVALEVEKLERPDRCLLAQYRHMSHNCDNPEHPGEVTCNGCSMTLVSYDQSEQIRWCDNCFETYCYYDCSVCKKRHGCGDKLKPHNSSIYCEDCITNGPEE